MCVKRSVPAIAAIVVSVLAAPPSCPFLRVRAHMAYRLYTHSTGAGPVQLHGLKSHVQLRLKTQRSWLIVYPVQLHTHTGPHRPPITTIITQWMTWVGRSWTRHTPGRATPNV